MVAERKGQGASESAWENLLQTIWPRLSHTARYGTDNTKLTSKALRDLVRKALQRFNVISKPRTGNYDQINNFLHEKNTTNNCLCIM